MGAASGERVSAGDGRRGRPELGGVLPDAPRTSAAAGADAADGGRELVLGPFQGKVACVRIAVGRGVCGTAVATDSTQLVRDVHEFAGHIACDSASNSEVVVPIHAGGRVVGVLDVDSPLVGRFGEADARGMETVVAAIERCCDFAGLA